MNHITSSSYSKVKAVKYAKNYAKIPNPAFKYIPVYDDNGGDCTNFTSQCLLAGGAPMVFLDKNPWWYNNKGWSISWAVAGALYWHLKTNGINNLYGVKASEVSSLALLEAGDIIFYENINGKIAHSATITSFYYSYPLVSQHTPNMLNIPYEKEWATKMHFMRISL
ncbi:amidase domain-containing protein [Clostridium akagii]|uniref:amidase domain-containing protein n=1 Tax=Clostridium akagii TaxID=91623 RepID=UPI0004791329|nr:amidase domain-containing protein [Clostridium akagii]